MRTPLSSISRVSIALLLVGAAHLGLAGTARAATCTPIVLNEDTKETIRVCAEAFQDSDGSIVVILGIYHHPDDQTDSDIGVSTYQRVLLTEDEQGHPSVWYDGEVGPLFDVHAILVPWPLHFTGRQMLCFRLFQEGEQTCILPQDI